MGRWLKSLLPPLPLPLVFTFLLGSSWQHPNPNERRRRWCFLLLVNMPPLSPSLQPVCFCVNVDWGGRKFQEGGERKRKEKGLNIREMRSRERMMQRNSELPSGAFAKKTTFLSDFFSIAAPPWAHISLFLISLQGKNPSFFSSCVSFSSLSLQTLFLWKVCARQPPC